MEGKDDQNRETDRIESKRGSSLSVSYVLMLGQMLECSLGKVTNSSFCLLRCFQMSIFDIERILGCNYLRLFTSISFFFMLTAHENDYSICVENALQPRLLFTGSLE